MSGMIRLVCVSLVALVCLLPENEARSFGRSRASSMGQWSLKKYVSFGPHTEADRIRAKHALAERAINKIRSYSKRTNVRDPTTTCDGSELVKCIPMMPTQNLTQNMEATEVVNFCTAADEWVYCVGSIDYSNCHPSSDDLEYYEIAYTAALVLWTTCNPVYIPVIVENLDCMEAAFEDNTCENVFANDQGTGAAEICADYVKFLACYYKTTAKECNDNEQAAEIVEEIVEIIGDSILDHHNVDCADELDQGRKAMKIERDLLKTKSDKKAELRDLLNQLKGAAKRRSFA